MSLPLTLSRAAQLLGVPRAVLQKHIAAGELPSHDGMVLSEDLEKLYPDIKLEDSGAFERIMQIKEQAFAKRVRERILPNQEILAQRLATQSEELEEVRRHLAEYHRLVEALSTRIDEMQKTAPSPQLAELARLLDDGLAAVLASEEPADRLEVLDDVLRVMTAQVKVRPRAASFSSKATNRCSKRRCARALLRPTAAATAIAGCARRVSSPDRSSRSIRPTIRSRPASAPRACLTVFQHRRHRSRHRDDRGDPAQRHPRAGGDGEGEAGHAAIERHPAAAFADTAQPAPAFPRRPVSDAFGVGRHHQFPGRLSDRLLSLRRS
jgi:hypothetical protein